MMPTVIRHVVLMAFADPSDATEAKQRLEALTGDIPEILTLDVGLDALGNDGSYDLVLLTTHDSAASLRAYQDHPVHQSFGDWVRPRLRARAVVDTHI